MSDIAATPCHVMPVLGTRPEAIKMAPLIRRLQADPAFDVTLCVTGQHREMLQQVLDCFGIVPEIDLRIMRPGQSINQLAGRLVEALDGVYTQVEPDMVLVHGDTTTCFVAALSAFHQRIPVGHVEAGLRTGDLAAPWPEEANRRLTATLATLNFAPTPGARDNLLRENLRPEQIVVTGNTVVDALFWMRERLQSEAWQPEAGSALRALRPKARMLLVTGHRRESFGAGFAAICAALRELADRYPEAEIVYPVHLNPAVREPVYRLLADLSNVHLIEPLDYPHFVWAMDRCYLILTDSGGIQEEAPSLGKPVLVMRDTTERPEAVASGATRLVGVETESIVAAARELMDDPTVYAAMSGADNPFGDGHASERILERLRGYWGWSQDRHRS